MTNSVKNINMLDAVKLFFKNYFNFSSRASRGEYWWFTLAYLIACVDCFIADWLIFYTLFDQAWYENFGFFINILSLATFLGYISLTSRRLQDTGRSGWWQIGYIAGYIPIIIFMIIGIILESMLFYVITALLGLAYVAFLILILVWLISPPLEDENQWGRNPLID